MDQIAATTSLISGIVETYNHPPFQKKLHKILNELKDRFLEILDEHVEDYLLSTENSVRPIKYYSVVGRVKEKDSFHEKMIRGNLIFSILKLQKFRNRKEIISTPQKVREIIKKVSDDIIGVKILTELESDCKEVVRLLKDLHSSYFNDKADIYLDLEELEKQPMKMKNGLEFYKVKGVYKTSYKFELQIKSKLLSAWGDMEHSMFYKDYSVSPVKENVKDSMINLGNLIAQVDRFLFQIRQAEQSFSKNRDVISFTEKFSNVYSKAFEKKLGFGYRLEDISEFLFFMYKKLPEKKRDNFREKLDFSILKIKASDDSVQQYVRIRKHDFNLSIIELVYFNWFAKGTSNPERKRLNFRTTIKNLISDYMDFLSQKLKKENKYLAGYLKNNFEKLLPYLKSGNLLYNFEKLNAFFQALSNFISYSDIEVGKYRDEQKEDIKNLFLLMYYGDDAEQYFSSNMGTLDINDLTRTVTSISFSFHDKKLKTISSFGGTQDLLQKCLTLLQKVSNGN